MTLLLFKRNLSIGIIIMIIVVGLLVSFSQEKEPVYVPDQETAIKIAEAVWLPIYGNKIYSYKPFKAVLKDDVWQVEKGLHLAI